MLATLFEMQKELDTRIEKEHGLEQVDLMDKKIMALLVELGELANETRCFKFWSKKPAAARDVILEEYVDGVHFILSIGLELEIQDQVTLNSKDENRDLVEQFQQVFASIIEFRKQLNLENYHKIFNDYILLGNLLGFTPDDIQKAYKLKNQVNHVRQDTGY